MPILNDMKKALHFGAGNIGRGFIGLVLSNAGYELSFADVNSELIRQINELKHYTVETISSEPERFNVSVVQGFDIKNDDRALIKAMAEMDLITTAVGPNVLPKIAPLFAQALEYKAQKQINGFIHIIACENVIAGSELLKNEIYKLLNEDTRAYVDQWIVFPNSAVDRIVPIQENTEPLLVRVEPYYEWIIDQTKIKDDLSIRGAIFTDKLDAYIERKLYLVNAGHAAIAYAAYSKGYATISDALRDVEIYDHVKGQMLEAANLLSLKHGFSYKELATYAEKTLDRFSSPDITDSIFRVGRSPLRKLSPNDRFIRPLKDLYAFNLKSKHFEESILNALNYDYSFDDEAVQLQEMIKSKGIKRVLIEVCGLDENLPFVKRSS